MNAPMLRLILSAAAFACPLCADPAPSDPAEPQRDLRTLEQFLQMSDAELDALAAAIARVRAMSVEERQAFQERIHAFRSLSPEERSRVRSGWSTSRDREDWQRMMRSKSGAEHRQIQAALQAMDPERRAAYKNALLEAWRQNQPQTADAPSEP